MIRKSYPLFLIVLMLFLICGCRAFNSKIYSPVKTDFSKYNDIHIGWIDFIENNWRIHGYASVDDWKGDIEYLNQSFQVNLEQYWLKGKNLSFSKNKDISNSPTSGLLISINGVYIDYNHYKLYLSLDFIDLSTNKSILKLERYDYYGDQWGFRGFLSYALDEVSQRIAWVLLREKKASFFK